MAELKPTACCLVAALMAASCSRVIGLDKLTFGSTDGSTEADADDDDGAASDGETAADRPAGPTDAGSPADRAIAADASPFDARAADDRPASPDTALSDAGLAGDRVELPDGRLLPSGYGDQPPNPACQGSHGPSPVLIPGTISPNTFCIDATPVTNSQYKVFLDSAPSLLAQDLACSGNAEYFVPANRPLLTAKPNYPVTFVDFCDAQAYCVWAGKRLCGTVGDHGGGIYDEPGVTLGELYFACSLNAQRFYPYGNSYSPVPCGTADGEPIGPVASHPGCEGGFPGLFDLSGEVSEWENLCQTNTFPGLMDLCRKGPHGSGQIGLAPISFRCDDLNDGDMRGALDQYTGFRCCSEAVN